MIQKSELYKGWYQGKGRNADVAYWTGTTFLTIGKKFGQYLIKDEGLYEEGWCFKPEKRLARTKIEPLGDLFDPRELEEFNENSN